MLGPGRASYNPSTVARAWANKKQQRSPTQKPPWLMGEDCVHRAHLHALQAPGRVLGLWARGPSSCATMAWRRGDWRK